jgi:uncharacterized membrane protein YgcG
VGIALMVLATLAFWGARSLTSVSEMIVLPPVGFGIFGAAAALAASYMPAKTMKGSQEAAKWRAFRRYLSDVRHYGDVAQAAQQFDRNIGYAVALGLEKEWVEQCAPALKAMPTWYFPTHLGGPWGGGYVRGYRPAGPGSTGGPGHFDMGGPGGLEGMSRSLTDGLNSMSGGLTKMLNDASRAMTSAPKSSGSRGGFSGGGHGGGGGSGGGSRGFG